MKRSTIRVKKPLMSGYVSEASNILIQRLVIQNNVLDSFALFTFDSSLKACRVLYVRMLHRCLIVLFSLALYFFPFIISISCAEHTGQREVHARGRRVRDARHRAHHRVDWRAGDLVAHLLLARRPHDQPLAIRLSGRHSRPHQTGANSNRYV